MTDYAIDIEIVQPGRPTGVYHPIEYDLLRLEKILNPEVKLSFDIGIVPRSLTKEGNPLQVILFGDISHPIRTQVSVRLLGGIRTNESALYLLTTLFTDEHFSKVASFSDLPSYLQTELSLCLNMTQGNEFQWLEPDTSKLLMKEATQNYRLAKDQGDQPIVKPAWKPVVSQGNVASCSEIEHYTAAEYTYYQLPYQIRYYVDEFLADDERILFAIRRPTMQSYLHRSWLGRSKLNEGILILTTQRLIQLTESIPLGNSGVRYGFHARMGILERLTDVKVENIDDEVLILRTRWHAAGGDDLLEWEIPHYSHSLLSEMIGFLEGFLPRNTGSLALQRSKIPTSDNLAQLTDPSSNDSQLLREIQQRFYETLTNQLAQNEIAHTWALWPAWFEKKENPQVLAVTNQRILSLQDPLLRQPNILEIPLKRLATLEYAGSIIRSYIGLNWFKQNNLEHIELDFPYPTEAAFRRCFEAIRRCMAVLPV